MAVRHLPDLEHFILFRDPFSYCAHPHLVVLKNGDWVMVFNRAPRREIILHPPEDPHYYNVIMRSKDEGQSWSTPRVAPGYDWHGVECGGLTALQDGSLLLNQYRFQWLPLETAQRMEKAAGLTFPEDWGDLMRKAGETNPAELIPLDIRERFPWARMNGGAYVHHSLDGGLTWSGRAEIETRPFAGGYGMRGGVQLENGEIIMPLSDIPNYRQVFVVKSLDGGRTWCAPSMVAQGDDFEFEEPCPILLAGGEILILLRDNRSHSLYSVRSADGGHNWSNPEPTGILGYPASLILLQNGNLLCVYGVRYPPFGIQAVVSGDGGCTWQTENPWLIRGDLPNRDLGYPAAVLTSRGSVYCVYYGQDASGVTCIQASQFTIPGEIGDSHCKLMN